MTLIAATPKPGPKTDVAIGRALNLAECPPFHAEPERSAAALAALALPFYLRATEGGKQVCLLAIDGGWAITPGYPTEALALAAALHFAACRDQ